MAKLTNLSRHARYRIEHRTRLSQAEITDLLEHRHAVNIGREPASNRVHYLFYSKVDDSFFVAVRDDLHGTVMTVLPIDFHENLAWKVKDADLEKARKLADVPVVELKKAPKPQPEPHLFVSVFTVNQKLVLKKVPSNGLTFEELIAKFKSMELVPDLKEQVEEKHQPWEAVDGFVLKLGHKGKPIWVKREEVKLCQKEVKLCQT